MKKINVLFLLSVMLFNLTGCYDVKEISYTVAAVAIGIDKGENMKYGVSFHIEKADDSGGGDEDSDSKSNDKKKSSDIITIEAPTVSSAYERANDLTSVNISIENLKMIILSEDICKDGIFDVISELMCDINLKNNAYVATVEGKAKDILEEMDPEEEEYLSVFYQRILFKRYDTKTNYFCLEEVYFNLLSHPGQDIMLPKANYRGKEASEEEKSKESSLNIGYIPKQEKHTMEFSGGMAFRDGKLAFYLDENDMTAAALIYGDFKSRKISLEYPPGSGKYVVIDLKQQKKPKKSIKIEDGVIKESINLSLSGAYQFVDENVTFGEFNLKFSDYLKEEINKMCTDFIRKSVFQYNTDIISTGKILRTQFKTNSEFNDFNYRDKMKNGVYQVTAELEMRSGGRFIFK